MKHYRKEFPVTEKYIYLDHAGVAPISNRVKDAVGRFLKESSEEGAFNYPSWQESVDRVRESVGKLINAQKSDIAFIRSTSHGLSLVAEGFPWKNGDNVLVYKGEFPSNLYPWMHLQRKGVEVRPIPSHNGRIEFDDIRSMISAKTRMISISSVQFATGFSINLRDMGKLCREEGIFFCVDAIQSLGVIPMNVKEASIDFLAADAHKWMIGPEGIGFLYCGNRLADLLEPVIVGWKSVIQEFAFENPSFVLKKGAQKFEEGSMNVMGIIGLGAAIELLHEVNVEKIEERVKDLGDHIIKRAREQGYFMVTPEARRERAGIVTICGPFDPMVMREELRKEGLMVNARAGGIRISPHFYNLEEEIDRLFKEMKRTVRNTH